VLDPKLFLPEPEPRDMFATIISVDDHVVEPPHMFEGRLPSKLQSLAPRIAETDEGFQVWEFEGHQYTQGGTNAFAGRRPETVSQEPARFEDMRPGCYDAAARIHDMDIAGIWATLNFPSKITGFCGRVFFNAENGELGNACIRAWNDWIYEEWYSPFPQRVIPLGVAYLRDPSAAAEEIRRNAGRGFRTVSLPERPQAVGLPSLWEREHWDPIIEAIVETDSVISLHVGSSGLYPLPEGGGLALSATLFGQLSLGSCAEWLWSGYPLRYPSLKIAMSEGGIGWVAMLVDRLENIIDRSGYGRGWDMRPADVLKRNFWFCTLDDPSTIDTRYTIGVDHIMVETDYPHGDSTWPDTQALIKDVWRHIPVPELRKMCCENAAELYRHPLPEEIRPI
jgi:predicted TIM-barrel fold metal-dependent hydrolase